MNYFSARVETGRLAVDGPCFFPQPCSARRARRPAGRGGEPQPNRRAGSGEDSVQRKSQGWGSGLSPVRRPAVRDSAGTKKSPLLSVCLFLSHLRGGLGSGPVRARLRGEGTRESFRNLEPLTWRPAPRTPAISLRRPKKGCGAAVLSATGWQGQEVVAGEGHMR